MNDETFQCLLLILPGAEGWAVGREGDGGGSAGHHQAFSTRNQNIFNMSAFVQTGGIHVQLWRKKKKKSEKRYTLHQRKKGGNDCFRNGASLADSSVLCNSCSEAAALFRQPRVINDGRPGVV